MRTPRLLAVIAVSALALGVASSTPTVAAEPHAKTLARHLVGPLSVAVAGDDVYVTQNFAGVLNKLRPGRTPKKIYASTGGNEVGGVSVRRGRIVFTETASDENGPTAAWLKVIGRSGKVRTLANTRAYENRKNPDSVITYGVPDLSRGCRAQWPSDQFGPPSYAGQPDSHPYATQQTRKKVYVADAGMNAVLSVSRSGRIRTVAVTPAVPVKITRELATQMGLPRCSVGHTYFGESVPTDVELGRNGKLYVTTEGGGLGEQMPLGSVYRIDRRTGRTHQVVDHLMSPTGLALNGRGDLFVAELFANRISKIKHGTSTAHRYAKVGLPGALEYSAGDIYATTDVLPPEQGAPDGKVVRFSR